MLSSVRLAAWLIATLIGMMLIAVLVPQQKSFDPAGHADLVANHPATAELVSALGLDRLFTGWPISVVTLLLVVNVSACTFRRLRSRRRAMRVRAGVDAECADDSTKQAKEHLERERWRVFETPDGLLAIAGSSGFWGSMVLHLSLLILAAGGVATALTAFRGTIALTEGQSIYDVRGSYERVEAEPRITDAYTGALISQDDIVIRYEGDTVVSAVSKLRALTKGGDLVRKDVRVNHPLDVAGKSYLLQDSGYAVALVISAAGSDPRPVVFRLAEETRYGWRDSMSVSLDDGREAVLRILATPVPLAEGEPLPATKYDLSDPRMNVELSVDGAVIDSRVLREGGQADMEGGISIEFEELRLWSKYLVRGEPGRWFTYLGLWLAVIGTAWRFLVPERRIVVQRQTAGEPRVSYSSRPWGGPRAKADSECVTRVRSILSGIEEGD